MPTESDIQEYLRTQDHQSLFERLTTDAEPPEVSEKTLGTLKEYLSSLPLSMGKAKVEILYGDAGDLHWELECGRFLREVYQYAMKSSEEPLDAKIDVPTEGHRVSHIEVDEIREYLKYRCSESLQQRIQILRNVPEHVAFLRARLDSDTFARIYARLKNWHFADLFAGVDIRPEATELECKEYLRRIHNFYAKMNGRELIEEADRESPLQGIMITQKQISEIWHISRPGVSSQFKHVGKRRNAFLYDLQDVYDTLGCGSVLRSEYRKDQTKFRKKLLEIADDPINRKVNNLRILKTML